MPQENKTQVDSAQAAVSYIQLFDQALVLQQQQNWEAALETYQKLLDQRTAEMNAFQASAVYHNMSNIAYEKGDLLKAYVWSKKSITLNPYNQLAHESFSHFSKKFETPAIAHQITNFDNFKTIISKASVDAWLVFSLILIFLTIWLALKNIILRKKNQLANNFSALAKWPIYATGLAAFFVLSVTYVRYLDASVLRGIVIAEKAPVQTAPGENKSVIFEAQAGLELEVLKSDQGYYQIRYPGAFSGWINSSQIELLSLNFGHGK